MLFLGTGASEMIPNPMCGCDVCRRALRSSDPREKRCRSALLLDEENLIDCGPDVISACARFGASLEHLKHVFLTHSHSDHFSTLTLENLQMCITEAPKLDIYLSKAAWDGMQRLGAVLVEQDYTGYAKTARRWPTRCNFIPMELYTDYQVGDMTVSAVEGRHSGSFAGENSLNYLFRKDGKNMFYACDTGLFFPESLEYLKQFKLDMLIIEFTFGLAQLPRDGKHLTLTLLQETLEALKAQGTITKETQIYATHIGHKGKLLHEDCNLALQAIWDGNIQTAYDGLRI